MSTHNFIRSGFTDEIGEDLEEQLDTVERIGLEYLDVRGFEETNVLDFSDEQVNRLKTELDERGIGVTSIGSPIGKIHIDDPFEPHLERFDRAIEMANTFDTNFIRIFSYYMPEGEDPAEYRDEVLRRTEAIARRAEEENVIVLHENEKEIYGDTPERCRDILTSIDSPNLRAAIDPANFLEMGIKPYPDALLQVIEFVDHIHVKDAELGQFGEMVPAGEGDGNFVEMFDAFKKRGYVGPVSLEPHLDIAGRSTGYSGPDGYERAAKALTACLDEVDATYE